MAKWTISFGVLLAIISLSFWFAMGETEMAALHSGGLGLVLILSGALANTENPKRRMLWMHIAVTVGLIGFLITAIGAVVQAAKGMISVAPLKFDERVLVALVCLTFVALCVRSFIAARRARTAA